MGGGGLLGMKHTYALVPQDFATGKRNNLEFINILNDDGTLNGNCGEYAGEPRYQVPIDQGTGNLREWDGLHIDLHFAPCRRCIMQLKYALTSGQLSVRDLQARAGWRVDGRVRQRRLRGRAPTPPRAITGGPQVRKTIEEFLTGKGLFRGTTGKDMVLGLCTRSKDVIEPLMRPQWCMPPPHPQSAHVQAPSPSFVDDSSRRILLRIGKCLFEAWQC